MIIGGSAGLSTMMAFARLAPPTTCPEAAEGVKGAVVRERPGREVHERHRAMRRFKHSKKVLEPAL